jgi:HPt (histidine-containing phosphotransfer) domain-containing protein
LDASIGLGYVDNDMELYLQIISDFAANAPDNRAFLDEMLATDNLKEYEIKIHSVKSTSRMVGAMKLGDLAEKLEFASRDGQIDEVRKDHNEAMTMYTGLTEAIVKVI